MAGLYKLGHIVRDKLPFLWVIAEKINSCIFFIRYGNKIRKVYNYSFPEKTESKTQIYIRPVSIKDVEALSLFFKAQPSSAYTYFKPHKFDVRSLKSLIGDPSFLMWIAVIKEKEETEEIVGYIFQRSYFWGISYRGYITDYNHRGCGIGKLMMSAANYASCILKLKVYGSISPENKSSLKLANASGGFNIIKTLGNGDYYVKYKID